MIRRPPRSTRTDTLFPTRRSSDLLALARVLALDQPADHRDLAERTLQKMRPLDPFDEFFGQYLGIEQILGVRHGPQRPDRDRIVGCDEAQGLQSGALHPLGDRKSTRLNSSH